MDFLGASKDSQSIVRSQIKTIEGFSKYDKEENQFHNDLYILKDKHSIR